MPFWLLGAGATGIFGGIGPLGALKEATVGLTEGFNTIGLADGG